MKTVLLLLLFILNQYIFPQYRLLEYSEVGNEIRLRIQLESCNISTDENFFFDESLPGEYSLPTKEIFIGIPFNSSVTEVSANILKQNSLKAHNKFNPEVTRINDSTTAYDFLLKVPPNEKESLQIMGFLWIDNIYTIHLKLRQYTNNEILRTVNEITEAEIIIVFSDLIPAPLKIKAGIPVYTTEDIIINRNYSKKFVSDFPLEKEFKIIDWIDYGKEYIKIKTAADDIYRITYNNLKEMGINPTLINPNNFCLFMDGIKIPIYVAGEANNLFEPDEYIEFWGTRNMGGSHRETSDYGDIYKEYTGLYSDTSVFWLTWEDQEPARVTLTDGVITGSYDTLNYYTDIVHVEQNNWFDFSVDDIFRRELPFLIENKTWGWTAVGVGTKIFNFNVNDVYPGRTIKLFAKLQSYASSLFDNAHETAIGLNNDPVGYNRSFINKYQQKVHTINLSSDSLISGVNKFKLSSYPTASEINSIFFDWYEIEYPKYLFMAQDSLHLHFNFLETEQVKSILIQGAKPVNYSIWKSGIKKEKYLNYNITAGALCISDTISNVDEFIIKGVNKINVPLIIPAKRFINLRDTTRQGDYILITSDHFYDKGIQYARFIEQNYNVKAIVINVKDIYDEFAYGRFNPEAIKDFIIYAGYFWKEPFPKNIFLVGDCTYDYHNNKHNFQGAPLKASFVPSFGSPVSDPWFVIHDTTGSSIPVMNIGRLPVNSILEFDNYLNKHRDYLNKSYDEWNKKFLFFSGGPGDNLQQLEQLKTVQDSIITQIIIPMPTGGNYRHFYKTINPVTSFGPFSNKEIQAAIDSGALLISYLGHSGTQTWDNGIVDPQQLHSSLNVSPLITDFGCSTGKFAEPDIVSFSELFTADQNGEAIAYIGNSSLGFVSTSTIFPSLFFRKILDDSIHNIGEAHKLAKIQMMQTFGSSGVYKLFALTNILIGDPIISLPVPLKPNLTATDLIPRTTSNSDSEDSLHVSLSYLNTGRATDELFKIQMIDWIDSAINIDTFFINTVPLFRCVLDISIPIYKKPGKHIIKVILDPDNQIKENSEIDNSIELQYNVVSSDIRIMTDYQHENGIKDTITLLNSVSEDNSSLFEIDISRTENFQDIDKLIINPDTFFSVIDVSNAGSGHRWIRGKIKSHDAYSFSRRIYIGEEYDYLANDAAGFQKIHLENLSVYGNNISLDTSDVCFRLISAGLHDGKTAVISKNGENFVPMGNVIGHHVCLFNAETYQFILYKKFDVFGGGVQITNDYYNFLDTLDEKYMVMVAVSDEGRVITDSLVQRIKEFGSIYIDSLGFRSSWAFIGRKGMPQGTVPELYRSAFYGRVQLDTTIQFANTTGIFTTPLIGPAANWDKIKIEKHSPKGTEIKIRVLGMKGNGDCDTLDYFNTDSTIILLNDLNYRYIKLNGCLKSVTGDRPELFSAGVKYFSPAELGTNFQGLAVSDTIEAGGINMLSFYVSNAGGSFADSFNVEVSVTGNDNIKEIIYSELIDNIWPKEKRLVTCSYTALNKSGPRQFNISIDPLSKIFEKYEDNNYLTIPFYVSADTTPPHLKITFDGNEIINGDYVSISPEIIIELSDTSPLLISDPASLVIYMDNHQLIYTDPSDSLFYEFNTDPKIRVTYNPFLSEGIHKLNIYACDASGNLCDTTDNEILFYVSSEVKLLNVYNYPNPFTEITYFTFRLTQIPDDLHINIYTVAGRLIKKISADRNNLKHDFNTIPWDGTDEDGDPVSSGVYLYKIIISKNGKTEAVVQRMARI